MPIGRGGRAAGFLAVLVLAPGGAVGQTPVPVRNSTDLFVLDLAGTPVGEIPTAMLLMSSLHGPGSIVASS